MRTAESYIKEAEGIMQLSMPYRNMVSVMLKQAMIDTVKECAKRAEIIRYQENPFVNYESALANVQRDQIDKQSILKLIDELK